MTNTTTSKGWDMSGTNVELSERDRLAKAIYDALDAEWADESNPDSPYVSEFSPHGVKVDGTLNLLQMSDALLAAGFGGVEATRAEHDAGRSVEVGMRDAHGVIVMWRDLGFPNDMNPENWPGCTPATRTVSEWVPVAPRPKATK